MHLYKSFMRMLRLPPWLPLALAYLVVSIPLSPVMLPIALYMQVMQRSLIFPLGIRMLYITRIHRIWSVYMTGPPRPSWFHRWQDRLYARLFNSDEWVSVWSIDYPYLPITFQVARRRAVTGQPISER